MMDMVMLKPMLWVIPLLLKYTEMFMYTDRLDLLGYMWGKNTRPLKVARLS